MNNTDTGYRIRERRRALDMTQEELGKKIGVSKATINKYETGVTPNLRRPTIEKLADALCTSPEYLMGWTTNAVRVHTNNGIIGQNSGALVINNHERELSKEELELLRIYNKLDVKGRLSLLTTAMQLEEQL
jgi:transcriptional regulator with XRE-family HTH domain